MRFVPVDLTDLADAGVLMAVNELVLWPMGLALTWSRNDDGTASDLHVRQWEYGDGHREAIALDPRDSVAAQRRVTFAKWAADRRTLMPEDERHGLDRIVTVFTAGLLDSP